MSQAVEHTLIGLDLNAIRVRAVGGAAGALPQTLALDAEQAELPLAVSLEGRQPAVGRAGLGLCRRLPHLACLDFLAHLGSGREWAAGRHRLRAADALALVFDSLRPVCAGAQGLVVAVPAYLDAEQVALLTALAEQAGGRGRAALPHVLGSLPASLASALAAYAEQPWSGLAVIVDADAHALTWAAIMLAGNQLRVLETQVFPHLSLRVWKERLLNALADGCVRQSRRDPRDSAPAEQALYEQLDDALEACRQGRLAEFKVQTASWYQNLIARPEDLAGYCALLAQQTVAALQSLLAATPSRDVPSVVLVTAAAGRLPGLMAALENCFTELTAVTDEELEEDFGANLLQDEDLVERSGVHVLSPDAAARGAHELATHFLRGELAAGHCDTVPLPPPQPVDAGPARLHFHGQEYLLRGVSFTLGRHPGCDLVFESEPFPTVSARHCEIVFDRRSYILRDRSRNGTLVNERPVIQQVVLHAGDWIRLGPDGPQLRFLGQAADQRKLMTTA
jgi:hypothetical protein